MTRDFKNLYQIHFLTRYNKIYENTYKKYIVLTFSHINTEVNNNIIIRIFVFGIVITEFVFNTNHCFCSIHNTIFYSDIDD